MGTVRAAVDVPDFSYALEKVPPRARVVRSAVRNEPVLAALRKVTRKDFSYDQVAWRKWWEQSGLASSVEQEPASSAPGARADGGPKKVVRPRDERPATKPATKQDSEKE